MTATAGYYLIRSVGWSKFWHVVKGGQDYADWSRARCGRSFDSEYAYNAKAGVISIDALCSRCVRSIGATDGPSGIISLGDMPRDWRVAQ